MKALKGILCLVLFLPLLASAGASTPGIVKVLSFPDGSKGVLAYMSVKDNPAARSDSFFSMTKSSYLFSKGGNESSYIDTQISVHAVDSTTGETFACSYSNGYFETPDPYSYAQDNALAKLRWEMAEKIMYALNSKSWVRINALLSPAGGFRCGHTTFGSSSDN